MRKRLINRLNSQARIWTVSVYDLSMVYFSFFLSMWGRVGLSHLPSNEIEKIIIILFLTQGLALRLSNLYKGLWRFSSTKDLLQILKAASYGVGLTFLTFFFVDRAQLIPRSVILIDWFVLVVTLGSGRFLYRIYKDHIVGDAGTPTVIIGAGPEGERLYREIKQNPQSTFKVVAFVDDDLRITGRTIHGLPVYSHIKDVKEETEVVLVSKNNFAQSTMDTIYHFCTEENIELRTLPNFLQIIGGKVELSSLRKVRPEDLLMREAIKMDLSQITPMIKDKVILVTGAGGSIGSELCLQLASFQPSALVLLELNEFFLYEVENKLREDFPHLKIISNLSDVRDFQQLDYLFHKYRPSLVFHAAAYKHVPMVEKNPLAAIKTNVTGTRNVALVCAKHRVEKFVFISTDKAVNPTNIMGATKRIAEISIQNLQKKFPQTQFVAVRFGNVLGSNGSVIPRFKEQIYKGGPITVTHPEINRFFMSIPEACQLVLQAATMGSGGEIFILEMGEPIKIVDLAEQMIRLAGLVPHKDIEIKYVGLRPGEKLFEELVATHEKTLTTNHSKVRMVLSNSEFLDKDIYIEELTSLNIDANLEQVQRFLTQILPEYNPAEQSDEIESTLH